MKILHVDYAVSFHLSVKTISNLFNQHHAIINIYYFFVKIKFRLFDINHYMHVALDVK